MWNGGGLLRGRALRLRRSPTAAPLRRAAATSELSYPGIIIGGGVTGCSLSYHLAQRGVRTVLYEKNELTSGATWHAAGLVTRFHGGNNFRLWHQEGVDLFNAWQKEGTPLSFHTPGSIRLIPNEEGYIQEAKAHIGKSRIFHGLFGCSEHRIISLDEIRTRHPLVQLDSEDIYAGLLTEGDGHIDPSSVTNAFADRAKALGGVIKQRTEVVGLKLLPDKRWEVITRTSEGEEDRAVADFVINAGGLWCDVVGAMAGVRTPSVVLQHQYVITETIDEVKEYHAKHGHQLPVLRDLRGSFYLRDEADGLLVGPYEGQDVVQLAPDEWRKTGMPRELANFLFEGDAERLMPHLERAMELIPQLESTGLKTVLNGPTMWPADGNHLVGPAPEWDRAPNFWMACAESYGIAHSAGLGRYLSEWIVKGEPPYELKEADPARYGPWATKEWVGTKVKETYGMNNHTHYPNENLTSARPALPLPNSEIYGILEAKGCQFGFHNGWESANYFDPAAAGVQHGNAFGSFRRPAYRDKVEREARAMAEFGGICYWPFAEFHISGPQAVAFMDRMVPNRLPKVGRCGLSYFLTPQGKVSSEVMVVRLAEEEFCIVAYPEQELIDWRWLSMQKPDEGVTVKNVTAERGTLMVAGPESRSVLGRLAGDEAAWSKENFKFYEWRDVVLAGIPCRALRVSFTGELGWELHPAIGDVGALYKALKAFEPRLCDWGGYAMGSFRLEKGFKAFGSDMTRDHTALEAGVSGKFLRMDKDFIGRDALAAAPAPSRKLVHLGVDTPEGIDCNGNEPIYNELTGAVVGFTTSGGYGYLARRTIAFGYVAAESLEAPLTVEVLGQRYPAFIQEGAFKPQPDFKASLPLEAPAQATEQRLYA
mmetsp:Transcript_96634/g.207343  ORF Transcript_96634/g.207343 Transcript_96634/m.207343 type:complete len:878 (-) Transcript_96634:114-2747(-)